MENKYKLIEENINASNYKEARQLILKTLLGYPKDSWLLDRLSLCYYQEDDYNSALVYAEQALLIDPDDPLILWDHGAALEMLARYDEAIISYERILDMDIEYIAYGDYGEGLRWAKSLYNDTRFAIALCFKEIGEFEKAISFMETHIANRQRGMPSVCSIRKVRNSFEKLKKSLMS